MSAPLSLDKKHSRIDSLTDSPTNSLTLGSINFKDSTALSKVLSHATGSQAASSSIVPFSCQSFRPFGLHTLTHPLTLTQLINSLPLTHHTPALNSHTAH
eukprot:GHVN01082666.1.p4 GENE.GHVN01082666.1~~GHVN01082666.1.p4  ORF type:complete len:100 (-),score=24.23 GHVN01082666.1:472-771(-)